MWNSRPGNSPPQPMASNSEQPTGGAPASPPPHNGQSSGSGQAGNQASLYAQAVERAGLGQAYNLRSRYAREVERQDFGQASNQSFRYPQAVERQNFGQASSQSSRYSQAVELQGLAQANNQSTPYTQTTDRQGPAPIGSAAPSQSMTDIQIYQGRQDREQQETGSQNNNQLTQPNLTQVGSMQPIQQRTANLAMNWSPWSNSSPYWLNTTSNSSNNTIGHHSRNVPTPSYSVHTQGANDGHRPPLINNLALLPIINRHIIRPEAIAPSTMAILGPGFQRAPTAAAQAMRQMSGMAPN
ncbi:hypothetical protein QBC37DRAFT_375633 [Rhypophila decipiens]|uniref:Uncharacterized protein n=1 Tax=Rhypophila decipiens TaxID=261697 RepID=A0AAN7B6A8_9PEZI|nr:hypothetical protein QBC37DRAFT_375633 [Rhypophila decipiens]